MSIHSYHQLNSNSSNHYSSSRVGKFVRITLEMFIMLQSVKMKYSKSLLLYQDDPVSGWIFRVITIVIILAFLVGSAVLLSSGETGGFLALLLEGLIVFLILWVVIPRKYQVFQDQIKIVFGGPFYVRIGFDNIKQIETTNKTYFTINYATAITRTYVRIEKKKGLSVAITPKSNEQFVENAKLAWQEWARVRQHS
jgi:hypothetical protein